MPTLRPFAPLLTGTLICAAAPALSQDICGGLGAGAQWIGGDDASSDITTAPAAQEQMALVLGGNEYVALFNLSAPTEVRVEAQGRGAADPQLDVFDADGNIMIADDDSGGGGAARAETMLEAGSYCVAVRSYDGSPMTSFVRVGRTDQEALTEGVADTSTPADPEEPVDGTFLANMSCGDARPLEGSLGDGGLTGTASVNENGYWSFSLDAPQALTLTATNQDADPVMTLFDANETYLAENDDFNGLDSQIDMVDPLPAGDYCIQITAVDDNALPITTSVVAYDPAEAQRQQVNSGDVAPPMDGSFPITDLGALDRRTLYDSLLAARVTPGTYVIGIKRLEDGGSGRARMVLEHYVPAP